MGAKPEDSFPLNSKVIEIYFPLDKFYDIERMFVAVN